MRTEHITFPEVHATGIAFTRCLNCGKRVRRQRTFKQTVSPFNQHTDGRKKTYAEVLDSVNKEARAWASNVTNMGIVHCDTENS